MPSCAALPAVHQLQKDLATAIRYPDACLEGEFSTARLAVYRELFFNNLVDLVGSVFPVARSIVGESLWLDLVRQFMQQHHCRTPLFTELGQEFLAFLSVKNPQGLPPFFFSLCHYEWVEVAVSIAEIESHDKTEQRNLFREIPKLSPSCVVMGYEYPVHRYSETATDLKKEPSYLAVFRDDQDEVKFLELSPISFNVLTAIGSGSKLSGHALLSQTLAKADLPAEHLAQGYQELKAWQRMGLIY